MNWYKHMKICIFTCVLRRWRLRSFKIPVGKVIWRSVSDEKYDRQLTGMIRNSWWGSLDIPVGLALAFGTASELHSPGSTYWKRCLRRDMDSRSSYEIDASGLVQGSRRLK